MAQQPTRRSRGAAAPEKTGRGFIRGEAGRRQTSVELEEQKRREEERRANAGKTRALRFYLRAGDSTQIIICDDAPDFFMYEHSLQDADGRWGRLFSGCTKTFDNCPVCETTKRESYYAMMLTCIDLTPYTSSSGERVEFTRKLLVVKPAQQKKFLRFYEKNGTLRGALFEMTRDGDKDSSIGNDIEFVEFVPEEEMATYTRTWKDRENKRHTENCDEPYVYEELFEEPTYDSLAKLVGVGPQAGSRAANRAALDDDAPTGRRAPARGRAKEEDDFEDDQDDRSFARRGRAQPAREEDDDDEDDDPPFEPTKSRVSRRPRDEEQEEQGRGGRTGVARRTRAAPEPDDDDDADADDAPAARTRSVSRRAR